MSLWQQVFVVFYAFVNFLAFIMGFYESKYKKNAYSLTHPLFILGIFAWGDAAIFGLFWFISSVMALVLNSWYLFLLIVSVFWMVRSIGETIYWFNQQFSSKKVNDWNKPKNLPFHSIFHNDSIWYVLQISWQCVTVISIISSIYVAKLWLQSH